MSGAMPPALGADAHLVDADGVRETEPGVWRSRIGWSKGCPRSERAAAVADATLYRTLYVENNVLTAEQVSKVWWDAYRAAKVPK